MNIHNSSISKQKFDLFKPVFSVKQRKFFESKSGKSSNASRDRDLAKNRLEESIQSINYLLRYCHNLRKDNLERSFTAQTLQYIFENLLVDYKQHYPLQKFNHDFRTTEIARLMFEVVSDYLKDATKSKTVEMDLARVSDHFLVQSEAKLDVETYADHGNMKDKTLTKNKEDELVSKRDKNIKKYYKLREDPLVQKLNAKYDDLSMILIKLRYSIKELTKREKEESEKKKKDLQKQLKEVKTKLRDIDIKQQEKIHQIEKELESKFDHLKSVYCRKKFLPQFFKDMVEAPYTIPEPDDGTPLLLESAGDGISGCSIPTSVLKENELPTLEMRKYYSSSSYFFEVIRNHNKVKWYGNEPSVSVSELRKYPPLNKYRAGFGGGCMRTEIIEDFKNTNSENS